MATTDQIARTISEECLCLRVRSAARTMTRTYDAELREAGVKLSQLSVLVGVARFGEGGATMTALAEVLAMDRTTLTRNLAPLVKSRWLRQRASPADARTRTVALTAAGAELLARAFPLWKRAQDEVRRELGAAHAGALATELEHLLR